MTSEEPELPQTRERQGPVGRPVVVLLVLVTTCVAAGYAIYELIKGMHL